MMDKKEIIVVCLLVLLNVIIRIPVTPHEIGNDSFFIHEMANIIVENNEAKWIINPLSFFGFYPLSYPSAVPSIIAITAMVSGLNTETTILFLSTSFGVLGVLTSFISAGLFKKDLLFQFTTAFLFSLSPLALKFTLWTVSHRGLFIMGMPLFLWILSRYFSTKKQSYIIPGVVYFLMLVATHKMFILLIPIIFIYFVTYRLNLGSLLVSYINKNFRLSAFFLTLLFPLLFILQFYFELYWWVAVLGPFKQRLWYYILLDLMVVLVARVGFVLPLSLLGLYILILRREKNKKEIFLILVLLFFTPLLEQGPYVYQFILIFFAILGSFCVYHITDNLPSNFYGIFIIIVLASSLCFSLFTLNHRYTELGVSGGRNYLDESFFAVSNFVGSVNPDYTVISNEWGDAFKIASVIKQPVLPVHETAVISYGFVRPEELKIRKRSLHTSILGIWAFVKYPYVSEQQEEIIDFTVLFNQNTPQDEIDMIKKKYNVGYSIENKNLVKSDSLLNDNNNRIYDNGLRKVMFYA